MSEDLRRYMRYAIGLMLLYALMAIVMSMLISCKTSKHIEQTHRETDSLAVVVNDIRFDKRWFEKVKADSTSQKDYWHMVIYDTSKPIDSLTNLPPVLADIKLKKERVSKTQENTVTADTSVQVTRTEVNETHEEESTDEEDVQTETKSFKLRAWLFLAFLFASAIMVLFGGNAIYSATTWLLNKILN